MHETKQYLNDYCLLKSSSKRSYIDICNVASVFINSLIYLLKVLVHEIILCICEKVVEPTLHRDFMYSSLNAFPRSSFSTVSTPLCSEVHKKLGKPRYRVSFFYTTCHYGNNPVSVL